MMNVNKSSTVIDAWKKQYLDGLTATQWTQRAIQLNTLIYRCEYEKNAYGLAETIHQGGLIQNDQTHSPTATTF